MGLGCFRASGIGGGGVGVWRFGALALGLWAWSLGLRGLAFLGCWVEGLRFRMLLQNDLMAFGLLSCLRSTPSHGF